MRAEPGFDLERASLRHVPRSAWAILLVALVLRLLLVAGADLLPLTAGQDSVDYDRHARSIAAGDGYPDSVLLPGDQPTAQRVPLYPSFLAAVYSLTGSTVNAARAAQAIGGTLTVALLGLLAWQLAGRPVALATMGLAAIWPPLIAIGTAIATEALFVPLVLAALVAAVQQRRSAHRSRWAALAGVLGGAVALTRPNGILLLIPLAVAVWPGGRRTVAVTLAAAVLTIVPWTIRTSFAMDGFVPIGTEGGYALAGVFNDTARTNPAGKAYWHPPQLVPEYAELFRRRDLNELELDHQLRSRAVDEIADHPGYVVESALLNTARLVHLSGVPRAKAEARATLGLPGWLADSAIYGFYPVALLALAGSMTVAARRVPLFIWIAPALFLTSVVVGVLTRYRAPIDPFLVLLAGAALASLVTRLRSQRPTREGLPTRG